jgi:hypothetical protein
VKLDALDHPKTFDFAARLQVSRPTAIGHLELLWAFTGKQSSQGNVGKWPDGAIARACDWMGDPNTFISALIESGFLDRDDGFRLTVHDWSHHAPGWVRAKLKKLGLSFVGSSEATSEGSSDEDADDDQEGSSEPSILVKGSEEKGSVRAPPKKAPRKTAIPSDFSLTDDLRDYATKHLPEVDPPALFESFKGKALAKAWSYANWHQAFQEYVRNCAPNSGHWASGQYPKSNGGIRWQ